MEFPARNDGHATQQNKKKQRGKTMLLSKIYMQEMMQGNQWQEQRAGAGEMLFCLRLLTCSCC
jgi:hypothetical protein